MKRNATRKTKPVKKKKGNKLRNNKTEDKGDFWENSSWLNQMILLCCFSPFWDLGGCGVGLERLIGFLLYSDLNLKIWGEYPQVKTIPSL